MKKLFSLLILIVFSLILTGCGKEYTRIQTLYPGDEKMWDFIYDNAEDYDFKSVPFGMIMPHHSITDKKVAGLYEEASKHKNPSVVVVIGPNHFEKGLADIQTCSACIYDTTVGELKLEEDFIEDMVDENVAVYNDETFVEEHAFYTHAPFIKKYFPDAKIVPIAMQWDVPIDEIKKLSTFLDNNLTEDDLVVASVDFSHYVPEEMASFHDKASFATIANFDYPNIFDLELDSPASVYTLMDLMAKRSYVEAELMEYTNLTYFVEEHKEESTSHQYIAFFKGKKNNYEGVSVLAFGNLPDDHDFEFMTNWKWDRNYDEDSDQTYNKLLRDIRGTEDRFLVGADYYLFDLPDNECSIEEQNNMKIAFCKFLEDEDREKEYLDIIDNIKEDVDDVVLLFEYQGGGELDDDRKFFTRALAKEGVDVYFGRGLDEVYPFETYKGSLLFHNMGDFMMDNKLVTDLTAKSSGITLGLHITPDKYYIYTFPIVVMNGYPTLVDYSKRPALFNIFKEDAILDRQDEVNEKTGVIKIDR